MPKRRKKPQAHFGFGSLDRAEMLNTRGFKEGNRSWIDVMPPGGPRMRVTHEVLGSIPPPVPPAARRKCIAWRYVGTGRRCALFADETGFRTAKPPAIKPSRPLLFGPLDGFAGVGSSLALAWTVAGGVALVVLSDKLKALNTPR